MRLTDDEIRVLKSALRAALSDVERDRSRTDAQLLVTMLETRSHWRAHISHERWALMMKHAADDAFVATLR